MPGQKWTLQQVEKLKNLSMKGVTVREMVEILNSEFDRKFTYDCVANKKERSGLVASLLTINPEIKIYKSLTIPEDNYMVGVDAHAPYYSEIWVNRMIAIAEKFKIKKKVHGGDLIDMDFAKKHYDSDPVDFATELEFSSPLFKALDYFETIYLIRGNHEMRIGITTENRLQATHLFGLYGAEVWKKKFRYSVYDKIMIGKKWMVVHPKSYSQVSGSTAVRLAEKFHCHVLNAHGHFVAIRFDRSGKYMGIDMGGLFQKDKIKYIQESTTTYPVWNQGFGMILDGHFYHFNDGTDWDFWLKNWF